MIPVMIVEDEFLVRAGLRTSLDWEKEGFEIVAEAQDGEEALELYEKYRPAIIITDIRLPKMDGISMMKAIRRKKERVSFIVISAYDDFQYAKESISIGVANYFLKGNMNVEEFTETLRELGDHHRLEGRQELNGRQYTVRDLYLNPRYFSGLDKELGVGAKQEYLIYFYAQNANIQMLNAMVMDYFQKNDRKYIKLEAKKGSWFLYAQDGEADTVVRELSRMFERYVDEKITLVQSRNLFWYPNMKEAIYHTLLSWEFHTRPVHWQRTWESMEEKQILAQIQSLENEVVEMLKFQKYDEAHKSLEQLQEGIIGSASPITLFDSIYRLMGRLAQYDSEVIAARTYSVLMESMDIEAIFDTLAMYVDELREKREDNSNVYILKVREYVEKNYHEPLRIKDLSDYIHVSPNYLGKIFYLNTGEYLKDYINSVKMEKARELLLSQKYQVSQVADMVGMENQRYFSKIFKKYYGASPKEYGKRTL